MAKMFDTLTEDIYHVLDQNEEHTLGDVESVASSLATQLTSATEIRTKGREVGKLWASDLGKPCMRQHWYNFNAPEDGEKLGGHTMFKFLYGNVLEDVVLWLAKEAGHDVVCEQERIESTISDWTVSGRIDAIIDGVLCDVKTTSSYGFQRYKEGITDANDSFGYLWQVGFYTHFNEIEPAPKSSGFVWIDKQNGHVATTVCTDQMPSEEDIIERVETIAESVSRDNDRDVIRGYSPEPYGKSGNMALPISCSYCPFKQRCYADANGGRGLRAFAYNHKPVWFTEVVREPKVPEITDYASIQS